MGYADCEYCLCRMNIDSTHYCYLCGLWFCDDCQDYHGKECNKINGIFLNGCFCDCNQLDKYDIKHLKEFKSLIYKKIHKLGEDWQGYGKLDIEKINARIKAIRKEKKNEPKIKQKMAEQMAVKYIISVESALLIIRDYKL